MSLMTLFAGSATSGFSPLSLPNLALWLDASDSSTVTLDGSNNVSEWRDKSGNLRHSTQASTLLRPAYTSAAVNGLNAITFDAADDLLSCYNAAANPCTWFAVHKWSGGNRDTRIGGNSPLSGVSIGISAASSWNMSFVRDSIAWVPSGFSQGTGTRLYRMAYDLSSSSFWTYNGEETLRQTTALTGTLGAAANLGMPGQLCEVVMYERALTAPEIAAVEAYLATKWSVNVAGVANPSLWLDASDTSTFTLDGSNNVSQWRDKSGNARHVAQATPASRPSLATDSPNGLTAVRFQSQSLASSYLTYMVGSVFIVWQNPANSSGSYNGIGGWRNGGGSDLECSFLLPLTPGGPPPNRVWALYNAAETSTIFRLNGVQRAAAENEPNLASPARVSPNRWNYASVTLPVKNGAKVLYLGTEAYAPLTRLMQDGQIGELITFPEVLSPTQVATVEAYLAAKWGVA